MHVSHVLGIGRDRPVLRKKLTGVILDRMGEQLSVFVSWSKDRSRIVAKALHERLPRLFHAVDAWMSAESIRSGAIWGRKLSEVLDRTSFAIAVVTPENQREPWLNFEAGSIGKRVDYDDAYVVPMCIDMELGDLEPPLSRFQAILADDKESVFRMMRDIRDLLKERDRPAPSDDALAESFELHWKYLHTAIEEAKAMPATDPIPARSHEDKLDEVLKAVRTLQKQAVQRHGDPTQVYIDSLLFPDQEAVSLSDFNRSLHARLEAMRNQKAHLHTDTVANILRQVGEPADDENERGPYDDKGVRVRVDRRKTKKKKHDDE